MLYQFAKDYKKTWGNTMQSNFIRTKFDRAETQL